MRNKRRALGARPRGSCPVCNQSFADATDTQFRQRYTYHLGSVRHKKALERQNAPPPQSGKIILKSKESVAAKFEQARNNPNWPWPQSAR
jgi:transposase-like protein